MLFRKVFVLSVTPLALITLAMLVPQTAGVCGTIVVGEVLVLLVVGSVGFFKAVLESPGVSENIWPSQTGSNADRTVLVKTFTFSFSTKDFARKRRH